MHPTVFEWSWPLWGDREILLFLKVMGGKKVCSASVVCRTKQRSGLRRKKDCVLIWDCQTRDDKVFTWKQHNGSPCFCCNMRCRAKEMYPSARNSVVLSSLHPASIMFPLQFCSNTDGGAPVVIELSSHQHHMAKDYIIKTNIYHQVLKLWRKVSSHDWQVIDRNSQISNYTCHKRISVFIQSLKWVGCEKRQVCSFFLLSFNAIFSDSLKNGLKTQI